MQEREREINPRPGGIARSFITITPRTAKNEQRNSSGHMKAGGFTRGKNDLQEMSWQLRGIEPMTLRYIKVIPNHYAR